MIAFPSMLINAANKANIKVPDDLENYQPDDFPHWHIYCLVQLGRRCPYAGCHFDNAKIISTLSQEECKTITIFELENKGLV